MTETLIILGLFCCAGLVDIIERSRLPIHLFYGFLGKIFFSRLRKAVIDASPTKPTMSDFRLSLSLFATTKWDLFWVEWFACPVCHTVWMAGLAAVGVTVGTAEIPWIWKPFFWVLLTFAYTGAVRWIHREVKGRKKA